MLIQHKEYFQTAFTTSSKPEYLIPKDLKR